MTDELKRLDQDGALHECLANSPISKRGAFLRGLVAAGLLSSVTGSIADAEGRSAHDGDIEILNFALTLEYLQAAFYEEVARIGSVHGPAADLVRVVGGHERAHVETLLNVLGRRAVKRPRFDFGGATETQPSFVKTAVAFEDLSVAAYKGQAPRIRSKAYLQAALAIHAVEARHAAWIRQIAGVLPAATAFDEPAPAREVRRVVDATHFIERPTHAHRRPGFTG
jgi:hypothetical protein